MSTLLQRQEMKHKQLDYQTLWLAKLIWKIKKNANDKIVMSAVVNNHKSLQSIFLLYLWHIVLTEVFDYNHFQFLPQM